MPVALDRPPAVAATRTMRPPSVSIIIPAYNEEATIGRCLAAAIAQTVPALEIIVVDNMSTDNTSAIVTRFAAEYPGRGIRLLHQDSVQGLVPTRNLGFRAALGDILGRIDADSVVDPMWVASVSRTMVASSADAQLGAVTGPVSYYDLPLVRMGSAADDLARRALRKLGTEYPFLYGSNMAIRATAWRAIEDETCMDSEDLFHEDIDIAVHLHQAQIRVAYDSGMRAGVSARRMDSAPRPFHDYTRRFQRTYDAHDISHWYLAVPQLLLRSIYWPVHLGRTLALSISSALARGSVR